MQSTPPPTISPCQLPADNADGVMAVTPPAGCEVGTQHLDALGHALHVGDTVEFIDADIVTITGLLPCGRFLYDHDRTNFCCVVVRSAPAPDPDQGVNEPQHLHALGHARPVLNILRAQLPPRASWYSLALQFTEPSGFWTRAHAGCGLHQTLFGLSHRTARSAAGGAL